MRFCSLVPLPRLASKAKCKPVENVTDYNLIQPGSGLTVSCVVLVLVVSPPMLSSPSSLSSLSSAPDTAPVFTSLLMGVNILHCMSYSNIFYSNLVCSAAVSNSSCIPDIEILLLHKPLDRTWTKTNFMLQILNQLPQDAAGFQNQIFPSHIQRSRRDNTAFPFYQLQPCNH